MVTKEVERPTLVPITPEWMEQRPTTSQNRNINPIYWSKSEKEGGYIIVGPSPATAQGKRWERKGRTPLLEYSYTDKVSPKTGMKETIEVNKDRLGTPWRFYWLFRNGGAHLFPIEQIVEHHWHIEPPYGLDVAVFPQLEEYEVPEPHWCAACPGKTPPRNSEEELIQHAMVSHRMTLQEARDIARFAKERPRPTGSLAIRKKTEKIEAAAEKRESEPPNAQKRHKMVICDCGEPFNSGIEKHNHQKRGECSAVHASASASEEAQE